jgi:putative DNA primase/helicase
MNISENPNKLKPEDRSQDELIVSTIRYDAPVGKPYGYKDGEVTRGKNYRSKKAIAGTHAFKMFGGFADWRKGLGSDDMLVSGTFDPVVDGVSVVYAGKEKPGEVSASKQYLSHRNQPGILIIDVDIKDADEVAGLYLSGGQPYKTHEAALDVLSKILPEADQCALMIGWSTSSNLYNGSKRVKGTGGIRIYMPVTDASQIPRLLEIMHKRSWVQGEGWGFVDRAGRFHERSFVDTALDRPTQPDFAAPDLSDGLTQDREWVDYEGDWLYPSNVAPLTPEQEKQYEQARSQAETELAPAMKAQRTKWLENKTKELEREGLSQKRAKTAATQLLDNSVLYPTGSVLFDDGTKATILELLTDGAAHDGKTCCDPVEPDYNDGATVGIFYWNDGQRPSIHSFAHGSRWYALKYDAESLRKLIENCDGDEIVRAFALCEPSDEVEYAQLETEAAKALKLGNAKEPLRKAVNNYKSQLGAAANGNSDHMADEILDAKTPTVIAVKFLQSRYTEGATPTLAEQNEDYFQYNGTHYVEVRLSAIRSDLYDFLGTASKREHGALVPFNPKMASVTEILDAVKAKIHLSDHLDVPCWVDGRTVPPPDDILVMRNGLLQMSTRELRPHEALYFSRNSLDYDYDADAPEPEKFYEFIDDLFGDDQQAEYLLQEMFGYILGGASSLQKILMIIGPKRSGKGTLGRVLVALVGAANSCSPRLESLGGRFGLQPLIGKKFAYMSDVRLEGLAKQQTIAENLLRISGEDDVNVERKNRSDWFGRLPARFLMLSNMVPRIADPSGALSGRFSMLVLKNSFYGNEDPELTEKLLAELPGILRWALDGWAQLKAQGKFTVPASSSAAITSLERLTSPVLAFLDDECVIEAKAEISVEALFRSWKNWSEDQNRSFPGTKESFCRDVIAAVSNVERVRKRLGDDRPYFYRGIRLRNAQDSLDGDDLS